MCSSPPYDAAHALETWCAKGCGNSRVAFSPSTSCKIRNVDDLASLKALLVGSCEGTPQNVIMIATFMMELLIDANCSLW